MKDHDSGNPAAHQSAADDGNSSGDTCGRIFFGAVHSPKDYTLEQLFTNQPILLPFVFKDWLTGCAKKPLNHSFNGRRE